MLFCALQALGDVSGHSQVFLLWCFDAFLIDIVDGTSLTWN